MQEPVISLKNVGLSYRKGLSLFKREKYAALSAVSFDVHRGETLGLVGRNGAGKSTLLRLLAGLFKPDKGELINRGASVSLLSLNLGFDQQLNGFENAILSALLLGIPRKEAEKNLETIAEFSELGAFMHQPVKSYSSGMRTRLGFSIALHLQPDVLLIDEVLGVGDVEFRQKSGRALKHRIDSEQTVVLVSHQSSQIKNLCDRVVWIENGVTHKVGPAEEIMDEYETHILGPAN